jgi:hypothetical protein
MRPYETHPFSRPIDLIIINQPLLTNFGFLRARFFGLYALYTLLFNFNFAQLFFARFYAFFTSFSACLAAFSRASSSRATIRSAFFLTFFSITSRAFSSRAIACCNFLFAAVRYR